MPEPSAHPAPLLLFAPGEPDDRSGHAHRQLIGWLGFFLPLALWLVAGGRVTDPLPRWGLLPSISAYYYSGAVAVFVGVLAALSAFLATYRGYGAGDRAASVVAAACAAGVACFPTAAPGGLTEPSWWSTNVRILHYVSAVTLFAAFAFISLVLFPKTGAPLASRGKPARNRIYRLCGVGILLSMAWAASALITHARIFWAEAAALEFFAVSWLVKGRVDHTAGVLFRKMTGSL